MSEELTTAEIVPNEPTGEAHPDVREPSDEQPEAAPESEAIPEEPATAGSEAGPAAEPAVEPVAVDEAPAQAPEPPVDEEAVAVDAEGAPVEAQAAFVDAEVAPVDAEAAPEDAEAAPEDAETTPEAATEPVDAEDLVVTLESVDPDRVRMKAIIEAVIYITDEPLSLQQIAMALGRPTDHVQPILDELANDYAEQERGLSIREVAGGYKMATKPEHHEEIRTFVKNLKPPLKLSLAALETLAVIAYKQPITAPEIMEIRGVQGAGVLKTLLDRKVIATAGRKNVIGKPILYKTTKEFLVQFGLKDLSELPTLKEFEELGRLALTDAETETAPPPPTPTAASSAPPPEPEAEAESDAPELEPEPEPEATEPPMPPSEPAAAEAEAEPEPQSPQDPEAPEAHG